MIYFNVFPWDDIYEIVMSSSNTNESFVYVVTNKRAKLNLDSDLLGHCRLGHINKKRIEKLQHNGLLDSTEIKSFEKCVACMSGYQKETMGNSFYYPPENKVFVAWNAEFLENNLIAQEASESIENLEIIQEEDTYPSLDTSLNHEEGDLGEPASYKAALLDPESDKWLNAINVEMQSMKDNEVWKAVHIYKARLGAKGFTQGLGINYEETFSPVADIRSIRILIAITAFYDYEIWQIDVKTAFLNGYLNKEAVWIRKFNYGFGFVPTIKEPINMYCDNTGAIVIAKDHEVNKGARHFRAEALSSRNHKNG
nr:hypothetical protein [Tanacetum cinerariifolium]GEV76377.1 hypothetical protein [Tanacetum cinerariifolium]